MIGYTRELFCWSLISYFDKWANHITPFALVNDLPLDLAYGRRESANSPFSTPLNTMRMVSKAENDGKYEFFAYRPETAIRLQKNNKY